jgi:DNA-binding GntR family transcriptional regulator
MPRISATPAITSLSRPENLGARIYADLLARLQRGDISLDERLVDLDLAALYGTSRMPARDALMRLVNEGYLERTTRGFAVPSLTTQDVRDIFEVRRLLEPAAAAAAAANLDRASEQQLAAAVRSARAATAAADSHGLILANMEFRSAWLGRVRNLRLAGTILRFADHAQIVRLRTLRDAATRRIVLDGLEGLLAAFLRRDPRLVRKRMAAFMSAAERAYFAGFEDRTPRPAPPSGPRRRS